MTGWDILFSAFADSSKMELYEIAKDASTDDRNAILRALINSISDKKAEEICDAARWRATTARWAREAKEREAREAERREREAEEARIAYKKRIDDEIARRLAAGEIRRKPAA
jgi:ribosomal protein L12E/L44/L45/RPP1/RPP2